MKKSYIYTSLAILALIVLIALIVNSKSGPGKYDDFAKCLTEKGTKMYGAYWCPHCLNQKRDFGSSWQYVTYIECSLPNNAGPTEFCTKAGINGYPTWEFQNGDRIEGEVSFPELSQRTSCPLPE